MMNTSHAAPIEAVQKAIMDFQVLKIKYKSGVNAVVSTRDIQPLALYFEQDYWMLVAFCRLRKAHREFRLDRILELAKTENFFPPHQFKLSNFYPS